MLLSICLNDFLKNDFGSALKESYTSCQSNPLLISLACNVKSSPWTISIAWNSMTFNFSLHKGKSIQLSGYTFSPEI